MTMGLMDLPPEELIGRMADSAGRVLSQPLSVLVVDDSQMVVAHLKNLLTQLGVRQLFTASNGRQAQSIFDANTGTINLILCDWEMPEVSGYELLRQVRTVAPTIPFVMITSHADRDSIQATGKLSITGYIVKPFTPQLVAQKLAHLADAIEDYNRWRLGAGF